MCEEVKKPKTQVPKAMVGTIALNTAAGLALLITLAFLLPDLKVLINTAQPVPVIIKSAVGGSGAAFGLCIPLIVLAVICGIGCTTAASRCTWAFSRDGAIPGFHWWRKVNRILQVPFNAMMLSMVIQIGVGAIYFGSATAFNSFSAAGVICLTVSYGTPVAVSLATGRKHVRDGQFYLGRFGVACNVVVICAFPIPIPCVYSMSISADRLNRLDPLRRASLLHAVRPPRRCVDGQLCLRRLRQLLAHRCGLVLDLGAQELPGPDRLCG